MNMEVAENPKRVGIIHTFKIHKNMKRLKLDDFKSKLHKDAQATDKLLGQVLGDCHTSHQLSAR